jgi:hypothetical protein
MMTSCNDLLCRAAVMSAACTQPKSVWQLCLADAVLANIPGLAFVSAFLSLPARQRPDGVAQVRDFSVFMLKVRPPFK